MIFQAVLGGALIGSFVFVSLRQFDFRALKYVLQAFCVAGTYFTLAPDHLSLVAHALGIGRGADLLIYVTALVVFLVVVASALQLRAMNQRLTLLVRELAIVNARPPSTPAP